MNDKSSNSSCSSSKLSSGSSSFEGKKKYIPLLYRSQAVIQVHWRLLNPSNVRRPLEYINFNCGHFSEEKNQIARWNKSGNINWGTRDAQPQKMLLRKTLSQAQHVWNHHHHHFTTIITQKDETSKMLSKQFVMQRVWNNKHHLAVKIGQVLKSVALETAKNKDCKLEACHECY